MFGVTIQVSTIESSKPWSADVLDSGKGVTCNELRSFHGMDSVTSSHRTTPKLKMSDLFYNRRLIKIVKHCSLNSHHPRPQKYSEHVFPMQNLLGSVSKITSLWKVHFEELLVPSIEATEEIRPAQGLMIIL